jgi:hypothetical protein
MAILFGTERAAGNSGVWRLELGESDDIQRGSGLPMPRRRPFAAPILGSAYSDLAALRHPWLRLPATPALGARAAPPGPGDG